MDEPREFDFRKQYWGHAIHMPRIEERTEHPTRLRRLFGAKPKTFEYLSCMGHCTPTPWEGDAILIPMQSGKTARWRIIESRWIGDPGDMFHVKRADFEGYLEDDSKPS